MISDFVPQTHVKGYFITKNKQILKNKNGKDYHSLKLQDESGIIDAKVWAFHTAIEPYQSEQVVYVEGEVTLFLDQPQLNIFKIRPAKEGEYDLAALIPHTNKDIAKLEEELYKYIDIVQDADMKRLLETIFLDEQTHKKFFTKPAAKTIHHAYLSGLLEHSITMTQIGVFLSNLYEHANKDLVITGCLLHDIGKIDELSGFPENEYTDAGQLLGHIVLGTNRVALEISKLDGFNPDVANFILHILISHHGEQQYGSPEVPKSIEAMIVHLADYTDSRLKMFEEILTAAKDAKYTGFNKILNRNIRNTGYSPHL
ncbi:3'-5' exoribonuclease YhaM family protein [Candidatus Epulonipiscium viviparus]|uniref:3'-5' exoribonuclease YhaM family protein n=1 Tax=Candidatus Epulonipiscium viviparus TaxID=420336 RepID=UPI00016C0DE9|nr:HD domain-containing protein [Candidatus Epulopiscium viviparus]